MGEGEEEEAESYDKRVVEGGVGAREGQIL